MASLKDLSEISGFSKSTISKALNGSEEISSKTKQHILTLAQKYNYHPNRNAQALKQRRTYCVTVLIPMNKLRLFSAILEGIEEESKNWGYWIVISQYSTSYGEQFITEQISSYSDGIILLHGSERQRKDLPISNYASGELDSKTPILDFKTISKPKSKKIEKARGRLIFKSLAERILAKTNHPLCFSYI